MTEKKSNGFGIASLVLGISSIIFCWILILNIILGILGIVFYTKQKKIQSNGIANAGLITSIIGLVLSVFYSTIGFLFFGILL